MTKRETRHETPAMVERTKPVIRQIEVFHKFQDAQSKQQVIPIGIYDEGDDMLMGIEDHLVERGNARWLKG